MRRVVSPAGELAYECEPATLLSVCRALRDTPELKFEMLVDLAGVDRSLIDLTIADRTLSIRGVRDVPEPSGEEKEAMQMIAMEIDYGPFEREVRLPAEVDVKKVRADQKNGLLWIHLPLKKS